tara:strand:- start:8457 stop:8870 length:414 start_codon:yes stop_codon:yes gene_type:complete
MNRSDRIEIVNKLLVKINSLSRGFFQSRNGVSEIIIKNNKPYFIDHFTRKEIYLYCKTDRPIKGFSNGGTMKQLVFGEFKSFIKRDTIYQTNSGLNAWYWGITKDEINELKNYANSLGYFSITNTSKREYFKSLDSV